MSLSLRMVTGTYPTRSVDGVTSVLYTSGPFPLSAARCTLRTRALGLPSARCALCRIPDGEKHVDEIMRRMQGASEEAAIVGFDPLPMRVGVAG